MESVKFLIIKFKQRVDFLKYIVTSPTITTPKTHQLT